MSFKSFIVLLSAVAISQCAVTSGETQEPEFISSINRHPRGSQYQDYSTERKYGPNSQNQQVIHSRQNSYQERNIQDYDYPEIQERQSKVAVPYQQIPGYEVQRMYSRPQKYKGGQQSSSEEQGYQQKNPNYQRNSQEQVGYNQNNNQYIQPKFSPIKQQKYNLDYQQNYEDNVNSRYNQYKQQQQSSEEHSEGLIGQAKGVLQKHNWPYNQNQQNSQEQVYNSNNQYNQHQQQNPQAQQSSEEHHSQEQSSIYGLAKNIYKQYSPIHVNERYSQGLIDYVTNQHNQHQQQNPHTQQSSEEHSQEQNFNRGQQSASHRSWSGSSQDDVVGANNQYIQSQLQNSNVQQSSEEHSQEQDSFYGRAKGAFKKYSPVHLNERYPQNIIDLVTNQYDQNQHQQSKTQQQSGEHSQESYVDKAKRVLESYLPHGQNSREVGDANNQHRQQSSNTQQVPDNNSEEDTYFARAKKIFATYRPLNYFASPMPKRLYSLNEQQNSQEQMYSQNQEQQNNYEKSSEEVYGGQRGQSYTMNHYNSQQMQHGQYDPNGSFEVKQVEKKTVKHYSSEEGGRSVENQQRNRQENSYEDQSNESQSNNQKNAINRESN